MRSLGRGAVGTSPTPPVQRSPHCASVPPPPPSTLTTHLFTCPPSFFPTTTACAAHIRLPLGAPSPIVWRRIGERRYLAPLPPGCPGCWRPSSSVGDTPADTAAGSPHLPPPPLSPLLPWPLYCVPSLRCYVCVRAISTRAVPAMPWRQFGGCSAGSGATARPRGGTTHLAAPAASAAAPRMSAEQCGRHARR